MGKAIDIQQRRHCREKRKKCQAAQAAAARKPENQIALILRRLLINWQKINNRLKHKS